VWALGRLDRERLATLALARGPEAEASVEEEWSAALEETAG
jgi:hypothetical protein